jgi:hypothetical protein
MPLELLEWPRYLFVRATGFFMWLIFGYISGTEPGFSGSGQGTGSENGSGDFSPSLCASLDLANGSPVILYLLFGVLWEDLNLGWIVAFVPAVERWAPILKYMRPFLHLNGPQ